MACKKKRMRGYKSGSQSAPKPRSRKRSVQLSPQRAATARSKRAAISREVGQMGVLKHAKKGKK